MLDLLPQLSHLQLAPDSRWNRCSSAIRSRSLARRLVKKGSTTLESTLYTYFAATNDKQLQQSAKNVAIGVTTAYSYDNQNRLIGANTGTGSTSDTYGYDTDGNLSTETLGSATKTFQHNASDALCWESRDHPAMRAVQLPPGRPLTPTTPMAIRRLRRLGSRGG